MREGFLLTQLAEGRALGPGCSLCALEQRQAARYLEGVASDGVNDVPLREALARQGGYCQAHTAAFAELASPLASAILLGAFVSARLARAAAGRAPLPVRCAACAAAEKTRRQLAASVAAHARSPAIGEALEAATLCLPHLGLLAPRLPAPLRGALTRAHDTLRHDLQEVIRKHDYRFREAITEREKASLKEAVRLL
jgi:hypothetical protein